MSENFEGNQESSGKSKKKVLMWVGISLLVLIIIGAVSGKSSTDSSTSNSGSSASNSTQSASTEPAWYPSGYTEVQPGIAFKWEDRQCKQYEDSCYTASLIAKNGCPSSVYAEVTLEDAQGSSIGLSNDTTSGLAPMQKAYLDFHDIYGNSKKAHLAKISCY
jgi:hypothetical protein